MNKMRVNMLCVLALALVLVVGGCKHGPKTISPELSQGPGPTGPQGGGAGLPPIDQEGLLFGPSGLKPVYFDYDSFALRPDAVSTLNDNAAKIKQTTDIIIQVEGHCDERGTQEYNLALGEKRALAVRDYLMKVGIPGNRIVTISYGEERPAVEGHDESAWKMNRRCEFNKAVAK